MAKAKVTKKKNVDIEEELEEHISEVEKAAPTKDILLKRAISTIRKTYGNTSISFGKDIIIEPVDVISTRSIALDTALGAGGIPRGRITEIYGPESSGKTTLALCLIAEAQSLGFTAAFIDVENAILPEYAIKLGVNWNTLLFSQPESGEEALFIMKALIECGAVDIVVLDSVAAMATKRELEQGVNEDTMMELSRLMGKSVKQLLSATRKNNVASIFINQLREKPGGRQGPIESQPGGRALKFHASIRMDVRRKSGGTGDAPEWKILNKNKDLAGIKTNVKIVKNKVAPPFKEAVVDIIFGYGIDKEASLVDAAIEHGLVNKAGAWFTVLSTGARFQGRMACANYFRDNPIMYHDIYNEIRSIFMATVTIIEEDISEVEPDIEEFVAGDLEDLIAAGIIKNEEN